MKIFKILLIILVPAMGFVGCKKSDARPCSEKASTSAQPSGMNISVDSHESTTNSTPNYQGRGMGDVEIYGSGDDDRDGGDKKLKKQGMTR